MGVAVGVGVEVGVGLGVKVGVGVGVGEGVGIGVAVGFGVGEGVGVGVAVGLGVGVGLRKGLAVTCKTTNWQNKIEIRITIVRICSFFMFFHSWFLVSLNLDRDCSEVQAFLTFPASRKVKEDGKVLLRL